ncbi:IPExxxVDY family protein [Seonamhaeicola sp. ML3]|uniref:IPExxxVDY family protein n=1 Tax=Seonamhaeicola sp. ML3 TaxID=2937786 RepID=UPI00200EEF6B|nr:IPExxxVDY family protein [Seonamhaeicola sp. ML3]
MAVHKLVLDAIDEDLFTLVAVHCNLEDYRLAFLLNKFLGITLTRKSKDLDFPNSKSFYSIYEWEDCRQQTIWNLVSNICKTEYYRQANQGSLFNVQEKITRTDYLIPERKTVNYFIKINSDFNFTKEKYILNSILKIPQVATAYSIQPDQLKFKDHLIF